MVTQSDRIPTEVQTEVTLVTSEACHFCEQAKSLLADLGTDYSLRVREIAMDTEEGRELMRRHRAAFPPLLLIPGIYAAHGRQSERKLRSALQKARGR